MPIQLSKHGGKPRLDLQYFFKFLNPLICILINHEEWKGRARAWCCNNIIYKSKAPLQISYEYRLSVTNMHPLLHLCVIWFLNIGKVICSQSTVILLEVIGFETLLKKIFFTMNSCKLCSLMIAIQLMTIIFLFN